MSVITKAKIRIAETRVFRKIWNNAIDSAVGVIASQRTEAEAEYRENLRLHRYGLIDNTLSRAKALQQVEQLVSKLYKNV